MGKPATEYRTDLLACPLNAGKLVKVRTLVLTMRRIATLEAKLQWKQFHKGRWEGFESMARVGWSRPWVADGRLNTTASQLVMSQVAGSLKGYWGNVQNTYTELVTGSSLSPDIRHQLHFINRRQGWFWKCAIQVKQAIEGEGKVTGKAVSNLANVVVSDEVRGLARTLIRKALSRHRRPHFKRFQPQLDQRMCFIQAAHSTQQKYWMAMSTGVDKERLHLPLSVNKSFLERNAHAKLYQFLTKTEEQQPPPLGNGQGFLAHLQAQEERARKALRNPYPSKLAVPNTVRLLLSEDLKTLTLGMVSDMGQTFDHQVSTYAPLKPDLALDLGLSTLFATNDGELHGRNWMETLNSFDTLLTSIAKHRQSLGLKVSSDRYRFHVQRLRGWLKTEIHRILNRLIDRKRPARLIVEALDFKSPHLSRRLNRLIQSFGQGVITRKLTEIERQFGIAVEYRQAAYTSKECHSCGYVDARNRKAQSQFQCKFCGKKVHADVQASRVLLDRRSVVVPFTSSRLGIKRTLIQLVHQFNERFTGPRGVPSDPRFTNPYFSEWAKAQTKKSEKGCLAEVIPELRRSEKKAA